MTDSIDNKSDVDATVEREHKRMSTQVVIPALGAMNVIMLTTYWSNEPLQLVVILHALILGTGANVWMTAKDRTFRIFGRTFHSRDDSVDFVRWSYNLLITDALQLFFVVNDPMGHVATWLILGLSAQIDTFRRSTRTVTMIFGFLMGFIPFVVLYGAKLSIPAICYAAASFITTSLIFLKFERTWVKSLRESVAMAERESESRIIAEKLRSEAIIGFQQRIISHEMANLMMIISLNSQSIPGRAGEAIGRAVSKFNALNHLVLDKYRDSSKKKTVVVKDFVADVNLLLRKVAEERQLTFNVQISDDAATAKFEEFDGAAYFIIQNILKNAMEAVISTESGKTADRIVSLTVTRDRRENFLRFQVDDTGVGMDQERLAQMISGKITTNKANGHGIGTKLVRDECIRNGFTLNATSQVGVGTSIWFDVKTLEQDQDAVALSPKKIEPAA